MKRPGTRAVLVLVAATALAGAPAVSAAPEHARLTAMCGTWDVEMTLWPRPGGAGLTSKGTSTMIATSYLSFGNVPEWKAVEIKYTRRAR